MKRQIPLALAALVTFSAPLLAAPRTIAVYDVAPDAFVKMVASSNAFEIRSSEIADQKATTPQLKEFAAQMIGDHRIAGERLVAATGATAVPQELAPRHAAMIAVLEGAEGADFDRIYADMQAGAHAEAVTLFAVFSQHGTEEALKVFATETLPTLEAHKAHIDGIVARP